MSMRRKGLGHRSNQPYGLLAHARHLRNPRVAQPGAEHLVQAKPGLLLLVLAVVAVGLAGLPLAHLLLPSAQLASLEHRPPPADGPASSSAHRAPGEARPAPSASQASAR